MKEQVQVGLVFGSLGFLVLARVLSCLSSCKSQHWVAQCNTSVFPSH